MFRTTLLLATITAFSIGSSAAQEARTGKINEPVFLGYYGSVDQACSSTPLPAKLKSGAEHGNISTKAGQLKPGTISRCPDLRANVTLATFHPAKDFKGTDKVVITVDEANGSSREVEYEIRIE